MSGTDADPWDFLSQRAQRRTGEPSDPAEERGEDGVAALADLVPTASIERRERGELRAEMGGPSLKRRGWPLAVSLALVFFSGMLTEMVGASQMLALAGPDSLLVMYPLGGLGLLAAATFQFRIVDRTARLPMLRYISAAYALIFAVAVSLMLASVIPVIATGAAWLLADQLNFLIPVLIWSLAGDEFNAAESRKIYHWIVTWTYVGQVAGLAVATFSPAVFAALGVPLPALLLVNPVICLLLAVWLPHRMRGSNAAKGSGVDEKVVQSMRSAWEFIDGVPVWRALLIASVLTFAGGMLAHMTFMQEAGRILGDSAGNIQMVLGGTSLAAFIVCWLIQAFAAERIQERLGIPGTLLILPIAAIAAGLLLAVGSVMGSLAVMAVGISAWRIPRWSVDENARRAALTLVPDERRARVSFMVDLGPVTIGLITSGPLALLGIALGWYWAVPLLAAALAALALRPAFIVRRDWDLSLLNWRLRRRKQNRTLDFE